MNGLRVLITNCTLATRTGTELYVRDLALGLAGRGHTPVVYTPAPGVVADDLGRAGIEVSDDLTKIRTTPDIIHGHHTVPTVQALLHFRDVPGIYVCHDRTWREDLPPRLPRVLRHVAVDYNCYEGIVEAGIPRRRIRVIYNSVDLGRFRPRDALPDRPQRALLFSNYASYRTHLGAVRQACARAGLPLDVIGSGVGKLYAEPEAVLGRYDLVFAKARCALEAMAVGAAVVLCDFRGVGPMVSSTEVDELRRWNFGMRTLRWPMDPDILLREMARYDARDAAEVSFRIRASAGLDGCVEQLIALYREVLVEHVRMRKPDPRKEAKAAAACVRATTLPPLPLRERLRRVPVLGPVLVTLKRAIVGPRVWHD